MTGATFEVRARTVVNACGVWADTIDHSVRLRPSKGAHLVVDAAGTRRPSGGAGRAGAGRERALGGRDARPARGA